MYLLRTRFKDEIVAEFLPPFLGRENADSKKVIIFCDGMPSVPNKKKLLHFWSKRGYWVLHSRYRGTWESGGEFLAKSPDKDIIDIIDELVERKKILSLWDKKEYNVNAEDIYIIGTSFGGATALLASRDKRVKKVVCISPVVDWEAPSEDEPLDVFGPAVRESFGEGYRFSQDNWNKLKTGEFFNPVKYTNEIDGEKVMIIHARDDKVVRSREVIDFAKNINCKFFLLKGGGHLSSSIIKKFKFDRSIKKFFKKN